MIRKEESPMAVGSWVQVGSGRATYTFEAGFTTDNKESSSHEAQSTLSAEMSIGVSYEGIGSASTTMGSSVSQATARGAEAQYGNSGGITINTTCPLPADPYDNAIGYWTFKVSTADGAAQAVSANGVCRYGEGYWNVEPDCPYAACIDQQCKQCSSWT